MEGLMTRFSTLAALVVISGIGGTFGSTAGRDDQPSPSYRRGVSSFSQRKFESDPAKGADKKGPPPVVTLTAPAIQPAPAEPVPVIRAKSEGQDFVRVVCPLQSGSAMSMAATLQQLFQTEGRTAKETVKDQVVIVPDTASNCLLISGPPAAAEEVQRLVKELDRPPAVVRLEVRMIAIAKEKVKKSPDAGSVENKPSEQGASKDLYPVEMAGDGEVLLRGEIATLSGQKGMIRVGCTRPMVAGVALGRGGTMNNITYRDMGTVIQMTPRMSPAGDILVELNVEDSRLGPEEEGAVFFTPEKGPPQRTPNVESLSVNSTVHLQPGCALVLGGMSSGGKDSRQRLLSVTAHVVPPGTGKNPTP
jgi:hypothetical protein